MNKKQFDQFIKNTDAQTDFEYNLRDLSGLGNLMTRLNKFDELRSLIADVSDLYFKYKDILKNSLPDEE